VSFALLRKRDELTSVVVDVESVCQAGRVIASENKLEKRITYLAADFLKDDLPTGFDMVMLCDVGSFFEIFSTTSVPHKDNLPWNIDWIMLEAQK
jgi:hypothetical protein